MAAVSILMKITARVNSHSANKPMLRRFAFGPGNTTKPCAVSAARASLNKASGAGVQGRKHVVGIKFNSVISFELPIDKPDDFAVATICQRHLLKQ